MQTLRKKTSPCKYRNDPGRFFGDGVTFKAKLIGILEVGEARGDRMCQEALQDLKMAIRAAGEHKQRITIHVTIDGLRLRDEKTSDSLYHHPVHKISFIAQDMTDSRAFGYIFGSPDSGHRFFGIKTDKAASQVVLAMRDLFQVVFELKKKEIEMARQQIQSKIIHEHQPITLNVKSTGTDPLNSGYNKSSSETTKANAKEMSPESVADLVDLEQELSSIQRGITQMERITPNEPSATTKSVTEEDPFGDSFTAFPTYQLLPPPESTRSRHAKGNKPLDNTLQENPSGSNSNTQHLQGLVGGVNASGSSAITSTDSWLEKQVDLSSVNFDAPKSLEISSATVGTTSAPKPNATDDITPQKSNEDQNKSIPGSTSTKTATQQAASAAPFIDAFTDLDPLGTGKTTFQENEHDQDVFDVIQDSFDPSGNVDHRSGEYATKSLPEKSLFPKDVNPIHSDKLFNIDLDRSRVEEPVMIKRDTDPFSPTRKKSDPFQEGDIFTKLDPFEFEFSGNKQTILPETKIVSEETVKPKKDMNMFNGPLQVNLPPEGWNSSNMVQKKIERQTSESPTSGNRNRPSVFKQNTVDVISSISSKKMPHLFGQKFSKRDSNSINMRRLQESDSLSENEAAPEPPPRPDSASHIEPPPLPPKKQFSDIVIRPRITSSSAIPPPTRYDYVTAKIKSSSQQNSEAPPIPLPSRKVGRTDSTFPGPGRPGRKPGEEDDYLTPITSNPDVPPLLPPPQTKGRGRRYEYLDNKTEHETTARSSASRNEPILPDITLSQLLTLGIDELAAKLNVPTSKLSTMTLVELTSYLSNFIENSKRAQEEAKRVEEPSVFKVNFDQNPDATFVAKFDDNFGEESGAPFVANFADFETKSSATTTTITSAAHQVPSADRYAVFREIIEQEKQSEDTEHVDSSGQEDEMAGDMPAANEITQVQPDNGEPSNIVPVTKIDTKITEAISQAKDRYAALRDIILVEDLFEKPVRQVDSSQSSTLLEDGEREPDVFEDAESDRTRNEQTSPENNISGDGMESVEVGSKASEKSKPDTSFMHTLTVSNTDDLEIDEYMHRAISNLSLESRERLTPGMNKSPTVTETGTSPKPPSQASKSPIASLAHEIKSQFNDMSTSPIPLQKSPASKSPVNKSPHSKSPLNKSPIPQAVTNLMESKKRPESGSLSDVICGSSPEADRGSGTEHAKMIPTTTEPASGATESWAIFEKAADKQQSSNGGPTAKSPKIPTSKDLPESPCSSDGKDEWKGEQYVKKWPKGQTSSSSRDLSPWDDETSDYKKRPPDRTDRHGYYMRHARRMNSCDDDYDYDEEVSKRRERRVKSHTSRSKENFEPDSQNWYHASSHHHWSPPEEDDARARGFDRNLFECGTYGPLLRDHKMAPPMSSYDRRYEKRKYYREYCRPDYEFESYGESPDVKERKMMYYGEKGRRDYENMYEECFGRDGRGSKSRDFFYDRDRKSFDRDSVESYDSASRRQRSFGSGDVYGSLDSREEFRERYMGGGEKTRSLRKSIKMRSNEDYEPDSENGDHVRRGPTDTRSLQRPSQNARIRKSSGSSHWDGEDTVPAPVPQVSSQKGWKRPSSASESERRLAENRRVLCHTLSGSDGEKDRRFRRRSRTRGKDEPPRQQQTFGTYRHPPPPPSHHDEIYDYMDYDEYGMPVDEDKFERLNRRRQDMHQRMMEADHSQRRKKGEKFNFDNDMDDTMVTPKYGGGVKKDASFYSEKDQRHTHKFDVFDETPPPPIPKGGKCGRRAFDFDDFEETPRSNASSSKFNFEEHGFESDFNSPPPSSTGVSSAATKSSFRFSNDFSEKEHKQNASLGNFESEINQPTPMQKLRFDDNITISKFDNDQSAPISSVGAFEDDFSKAEFVLENEDRWTSELPKRNNNSRFLPKQRQQQDQIKKSESVNIFGRKSEDPFEDDDFFKSSSSPPSGEKDPNKNDASGANGGDKKMQQSTDNGFNWDSNFAKFDENM
ncbi:protein disabled isoform X3 [Hermetia illucens]|uniref:protein disabled isoform X3 n=1 Tax=Hermetia illucens TaxID=343691 RepID=UPI0018CC04A1|nr:protein disabled isoform X3 [Hermetia illucens]